MYGLPEKRVAIIVLNLNGFDISSDCIQSLQGASYTSFDIILVDNGSTDGSGSRLKERHPEVVLLTLPRNMGFTGGNNAGLEYVLQHGYEFALLLNNDTFAKPDFLEPLVHFMDAHKSAGIVQPLIYFNHDRSLIWNAGAFYNRFFGFPYTRGLNRRLQPNYNTVCNVDWVTGCAFFIRTAVLRKSGLFAANMFLYCEDVELSFRVKQLGYDLFYEPRSVIYHIAGATGKKNREGKEGKILPQIHYFNQRNRIWVLKKYTPWFYRPTVFVANSGYVLGVLLYFAARGRWQKLRAVLHAVKDGITGSISFSSKVRKANRMEQISSV
jgi:GT2 family glycosyltransferase